MHKIKEIVPDELFAWMKGIRRKIHEWPETAFQEHKTAEIISLYLKKLGIEYKTGIAKTGIVGNIKTDQSAPTVALRADMDALPIWENTGLPFSSKIPGIMHACGHDGHVAMLLGAARLLKESLPHGGARPMIEEGVLDNVDVIFGGHIERYYQVGEIAIRKGIHTSYTDYFELEVTGRGGHAARPHEAIDAVVIASQLVINLQTIVSRELDPLHPSVITIGVMQAGTVYNAIAEKAILKGTIRTTEESLRSQIIDKIRGVASSLSSLYGAKIEVKISAGYPPVINHEREYEFAKEVAERLLGTEKVYSLAFPSLGGEDFGYYTQKIPGCFIRFGAAKKGYEQIASHSPRFDFDEGVLRVGAAFMSELVRHAIEKLKTQ
jgi:hippurate hydrolase